MSGSVVNMDCLTINSMVNNVDPVNCCKSVKNSSAAGVSYDIACSPDGSRVISMSLERIQQAGDICQITTCPEVSMEGLTTLTELTFLYGTAGNICFLA
ncbi:hypothetical protein HDU97_001985 [Phlyctochytrium planicorne]|nr:hypothetical protein HDU97_001985 [Phlyctochytrium planicorne]